MPTHELIWEGGIRLAVLRGSVVVVSVLGPARGRVELVVWRVDGLEEDWADFMTFCYDSVSRVRENCP